METTALNIDHGHITQDNASKLQCEELLLEGLMYPCRTAEKGLCWPQLEVGPDLSPGAYISPVGDAKRAVYLACGAHIVTAADAELSRCQLGDRPCAMQRPMDHLDGESSLLAIGMKRSGPSGEFESLVMSLPQIIVALGQISSGFRTFISAAGYAQRPGFDGGEMFVPTGEQPTC